MVFKMINKINEIYLKRKIRRLRELKIKYMIFIINIDKTLESIEKKDNKEIFIHEDTNYIKYLREYLKRQFKTIYQD